ncbi:lipoprotein [Streptomyces sp. WM6373]|nr:lipoprotein [Streptomyces sp. WM6373]KOU87617.1 lipoprotein [Streptomyces sp. XY58]KOV06419.1 lipoprotein [Streptomyces sp. XY37]KOV17498.1 lipoprotein [Streptomyces sp. XY413]KOV40203.1 lipoprotein [Streptomyces sp. H021]KOV48665.1 lipoprotein [Streptomyces sp. MMG1064]
MAACGAGKDAQTLQIKPDNAAVTKGDIEIQNALVITQGEKDKKGPAVVSATVFNNGTKAQTLDGITLADGKGKVALKPAEGGGKITVPAGGSVVLGGKGNASAVIENGSEAAKNGDVQKVVFQLSSTGGVELQAFVVPATGMYAGFGPSAAPSATPAGTPSATPAATPGGTPAATPAAGATPSGSASGAAASPSGSASHAAGH